MGCQLSQCDTTSQKLIPTQCAWATIEREAYAVGLIWALSRFRDIVFGSHITIFVDHNPLKYLTERAPKSAKLTRWTLALQEYNVTFQYTKGKTNVSSYRVGIRAYNQSIFDRQLVCFDR